MQIFHKDGSFLKMSKVLYIFKILLIFRNVKKFLHF